MAPQEATTPDERMTMAVAEVTEAAAVLQGLAAQVWQLIRRMELPQECVGVYTDWKPTICRNNLVTTNPD
jgi:hypothetical protein